MIKQEIWLPAYKNSTGFVFKIAISFEPDAGLAFTTEGKMAHALLPVFKKVVAALINTQHSWSNLIGKFKLFADYPDYEVGQSDSAGLGFAIGLYNIARKLNGSSSLSIGITGTGVVMSNGYVDHIGGAKAKQKAAKLDIPGFKKLLTPEDIPHLAYLHHRLFRYL